MRQNKPLVLTAIVLMLAIGNYFRIEDNGNIRTIQFLSIFVIGMLSGILLREMILMLKKEKN